MQQRQRCTFAIRGFNDASAVKQVASILSIDSGELGLLNESAASEDLIPLPGSDDAGRRLTLLRMLVLVMILLCGTNPVWAAEYGNSTTRWDSLCKLTVQVQTPINGAREQDFAVLTMEPLTVNGKEIWPAGSKLEGRTVQTEEGLALVFDKAKIGDLSKPIGPIFLDTQDDRFSVSRGKNVVSFPIVWRITFLSSRNRFVTGMKNSARRPMSGVFLRDPNRVKLKKGDQFAIQTAEGV